jgi:hypothetical protein
MFTSKFKNKIIKKKNSKRKRNNIKYLGGASYQEQPQPSYQVQPQPSYQEQPSYQVQPKSFSYDDIFTKQTKNGKDVWSI